MTKGILKGRELNFDSELTKLSLGEFIFQFSVKYGNNICQIDGDLDECETYKSLLMRSVRLAISLKKKGISSKDVICFCCYNSLDGPVPIVGSLYLGAKVASLDPSLSTRNIKHLLTLANPRIVFAAEESVEVIENCKKEANLTFEIIVLGKSSKYETFSDLVRTSPDENNFKPSKVDVHDTAVMFFSSGTTGLPKAICHSHYTFLRAVEIGNACRYDSERILHFTTFYWISGMLMLIRSFFDGSTRIFARNMEGESTFKMIQKYKISSIFVAPIYTYELTNVVDPQRYDISSFRCLLTGGTSISTDQYKKLVNLFPNTNVLFGYGMTEIGMISVFDPIQDSHLLRQKIGSCGRIVPGTTLKIVDTNTEKILGPYEKGEVRVKSDGVMKGYYRLDSTSVFDSEGFLKTGDIGYYDEDNCLYLVERMKEMFKYRSWHIVPSAIEAVLSEHPAVKECAVFGIPRGEEGDIPAACVVLKKGYDVEKEEIEKFVEERVSDKEKLRGGAIFVKHLPRTPTGKLIRNEVKNVIIKSM